MLYETKNRFVANKYKEFTHLVICNEKRKKIKLGEVTCKGIYIISLLMIAILPI